MSVKLRTKRTKNGGETLYLDIYLKGKRKYEFLGLTLKKNDPNKKKILEIAEKRRSQVELANFAGSHDLQHFYNGNEDFIKYYESKCKDKLYLSSFNNFHEFVKGKLINGALPFNKIDEKLCEDYKSWLIKKPMKNNSVWVTILKLKTILNKAVKEKIIPFNPAKNVEVKLQEVEKIYLTMDELKLMYNKPHSDKEFYRAFMFACFSGLRYCDIKELTWGQIREGKIFFRQKKTKGVEYLPLSESAQNILNLYRPELNGINPDKKIFNISKYHTQDLGRNLTEWAKKAEVNKKLTFHTARHTFATLSLTYGVDLYTVSKLLGHKNINTTQIYAKIINEKLNEAVTKIPLIK